jgi:xanthine dehydrogenase YagS FAD-binding subunit
VRDFEYVTPVDLPSAAAFLERHGGRAALKAGGTDLVDLMKEGIAAPESVINLLGIRGVSGVEDAEGGNLTIGALATLDAVASDRRITRHYHALALAAGDAATPQIRNVATIGGNLCQRPRCWYFRSADFPCLKKGGDICFSVDGDNRFHAIFGDGPCFIVTPSSAGVALVALGATIETVSAKGQRSFPAEELFAMPDTDVTREITLSPGEIIARVGLPAPPPGSASSYVKIKEKEAHDWPLAEVAIALTRGAGGTVTAARVVLGAAAPVPWRALDAERALVGRRIDEKSAAVAADAAVRGARPMSGNAYKVALAREAVRRAVLAAV